MTRPVCFISAPPPNLLSLPVEPATFRSQPPPGFVAVITMSFWLTRFLSLFIFFFQTERMTSNLKKFRMQTFRDVEGDSDEDPEDNTAASIKKRHKRETERAERENRENTSALLELRDMEDELKTLSRLFDTQNTMIGRMLEIYSSTETLKELTHNGRGYLQEALARLAEYKTQTTEMIERVGATRGDVS